MRFAQIRLHLLEPLHIGAGRAGMVSRTLGFVPGHVLAYALAAVLGRRLGGRADDFDRAVSAIRETLRCGPLLLWTGEDCLLPRRDHARIEAGYLTGANHTALDGSVRRHVDGGLFEVEAIAARPFQGVARGPTELRGGLWFGTEEVSGVLLEELFGACILGGERNAGMGRVTLVEWDAGARTYAGVGQVEDGGKLSMRQGDILPGPALDGVSGASWQPWLGRLHDRTRGAGRRISKPVLVRVDGAVSSDGCFELEAAEEGFGCWKPCA